MRNGSGQTEVGTEELDNPGGGVVGESLLGEEGRVDFIIVVEDEELVVDGAVFVEERLGELEDGWGSGE